MTKTTPAIETLTPSRSAEYESGEKRSDQVDVALDTRHFSVTAIPNPVKRVYVTGGTDPVTTVAIRYSDKEAQEKLARLRFNQAQMR
jgi:hypothetical protein